MYMKTRVPYNLSVLNTGILTAMSTHSEFMGDIDWHFLGSKLQCVEMSMYARVQNTQVKLVYRPSETYH